MNNLSISPATTFLNYWKIAATWKASLIANVARPSDAFKQAIWEALCITDGPASVTMLESLVKDAEDGRKRGRMLVAMEVIDTFFYQIHPRAIYDTNSTNINLDKNHWIKILQSKRILSGFYCSINGRKLIPRGPLTRQCRPISAANADCFRDRFSALSVVEQSTSVHEVPVKISLKVRLPSSPQGIASDGIYRDKSIAFIPLAEEQGHLDVAQRTKEKISFVDFRAAEALDVPAKTMGTLQSIGYSDIIIAPELIISESDSKLIKAGIQKDTGHFRAFIAGSGHTVSTENGQSWNKSNIYNGAGGLVFGQKKIWLADVSPARAEEFGLDTSASKIIEDNASGDELIVADLDGFGRCVILICQDLNAHPMADFVIGNYQPDWVFVPILDVGVSTGRWFHQRIIELSNLAPTRFLVCSSLSLADKAAYKDVACGLAFGPICEQSSDEEPNTEEALNKDTSAKTLIEKKNDPKRFTLASVTHEHWLGYSLVNWNDAWSSTRIIVKPI
ncbi:hypothetical protein I4436_09920 [Pseudomonas qingdaonensis]|jgi:hypothetical protein|uniref:hypothetical protein n=1 Tax=Pseudomonas qingdaonensis TaxID=2056231 RepID=UPI0018CB9837|nr:hypothetical protein [Pseudomonas qingdaonensis]MBG8559925.1 hypothetical protein [Pseudomonas qingdaonensis]